MGDEQYTIRVMTKDDVLDALDVWRETGLQEGNECLYTWLEVDKEGFHVAVTDSGKVIGVCCSIIQHDDLAYMGIYAVRTAYRGSGIGKKLWEACYQHIGDKNAAVSAVPDKTDLYRSRGGFPILDEGWSAVVNETTETVNYSVLSDNIPEGVEIHSFQDHHLPSMYEYDLELVGYSRETAIRLTCNENDSRTFVALKDRKCVGFGTIKSSCTGAGLIGPLYADDPAVAEVMLRKLIVSLPEVRGFSMMTVSTNDFANELLRRIGCPVFEECPRLYRKKKLAMDSKRVHGLLDLNFSPY